MGELVGYKVREGVGLITVDNPPINALSRPVRAGLLAAVETAIADPAVGAIVIQAEGRTFPAGADLRDFHANAERPSLGDVARAIEDSPKPVLAAIHGTALGGGLELALACHYRIAQSDAQMGLPDVALGAVPSAGASQRLPRIVGAKTAMDLLLSARPISAGGAARIGLIDKVIEKNLARAAFGSARNFVGAGTPPRPSRARREGFADPRAYLEAVEARRAAMRDERLEAARVAVDLVEAALLLPFEAGLERERVSFEDLVEGDQARGLRHAFLAERRTVPAALRAMAGVRRLRQIGVIGTGALAREIVLAGLAARRQMVLHDEDTAALDAATTDIRDALGLLVDAGSLTEGQLEARLALLYTAPDPEALAPCEAIIEAREVDDDAAQALYERLGAIAATDSALVSATVADGAALDVRARAAQRPARVVGITFARPADAVRLAEIHRSGPSADETIAGGVAVAQALGKVALLAARPGADLLRPMLDALWRASAWLVEEGASPNAVDAALRRYGFHEGPFEMMDRLGLDRLTPGVALLDRMRSLGWIGQAAGRGFRAYGETADPEALAPGVDGLIDVLREDLGIEPRRLGEDEIAGRVLGALTNTGARLVAQGIAARPSDIDAAMVLGYGFPRWRGGPMEAADLEGLLKLRNHLRSFAAGRDGALWQPDGLFDDLIKNGRGFESLNR